MGKKSIAERVIAIISPAIEELGIELVDVEYLKEGSNWYLRIYIDQDKGIGLNECERVSKIADKLLDQHDQNDALFPGSYILEVSSPGLTRALKKERDFLRSIGKPVTVKMYAPFNGKKEHEGILLAYDTEALRLKIKEEEVIIPQKLVSVVHLSLSF
ncbi:MAG: ribosome maturation factor RimP [Bacillota bacterium]